MSLSTVQIDPNGFDPVDGAPGGVNADEATPKQLASAFAGEFGPFDRHVEVVETDEYTRLIQVRAGRQGWFAITADVIRGDDGEVVDNVLEIWPSDYKEGAQRESATDIVNNLLENDWDAIMAQYNALPFEQRQQLRRAAADKLVADGAEEVGTSDVNHQIYVMIKNGEFYTGMDG